MPLSWISKKTILGPGNPRMANIYLQTKFDANQPGNGRDAPVYVFPRLWPSALLDLLFPILDHQRRALNWLRLPANGILIQSDMIEILWFYSFPDLAGKCLFASILDSFWNTLEGQRWCNVGRNELILTFGVFTFVSLFV